MVYIVTYDLIEPGQRYQELIDMIKKNGSWTKLGGASYWRSIIEADKDKLESRKYLDAIDSYFSSEHLSSDTQQGLEAQEGVVASE